MRIVQLHRDAEMPFESRHRIARFTVQVFAPVWEPRQHLARRGVDCLP